MKASYKAISQMKHERIQTETQADAILHMVPACVNERYNRFLESGQVFRISFCSGGSGQPH